MQETPLGELAVASPAAFDALLTALRADGFRLLGPTLRAGAVVYADITTTADLAAGIRDWQEPGRYRLEKGQGEAWFAAAVGPQSWKPFLFAPEVLLWTAARREHGFVVEESAQKAPPLALVGARPCDLHAIAIQDRILLGSPSADADYALRRRELFVVAANCTRPGGTCFCVSMGTGPRATLGFDLAVTELTDGGHRFLVERGTPRGAALLARVPHAAAQPADVTLAASLIERTAHAMGRTLETHDIKSLLYRNLEHPRWDEVAQRCLACTNCTLVCPTCFCASIEDTSSLDGAAAQRLRRWESCFTLRHSFLHGGSIRRSIRSRYRQWLTHKVASWIDQYGVSGCVGCGRCITWCPVGIDLTDEVAAIRASDGARAST
jgi:sulfhydrogenase subunit beta (sulfur reductase)